MKVSTKNTSVIVVGNGIAGLMLARQLQAQGIEHVVLARTEQRKALALSETLPPSALPLLASLNLLELFTESSSKSFGYHSLWGSSKVVDNNFFFHHPYKHGLKLDKPHLLKQLSEKVNDHILPFDAITEVNVSDQGASVTLQNAGSVCQINGKLIVDATGRNRAIIKRLKVPIVNYDDLVACVCHVPFFKHPQLKHRVFVEAFETGWGIVSSLNDETNVMTLFSHKGNPTLKQLKDFQSWSTVLSQTHFLKDFLPPTGDFQVQGRSANSTKPEQVAGQNWLAIGDAALAFDPLSSHGVSNAIYCAQAASQAIFEKLSGSNTQSFVRYDQTIAQIFDQYLEHKTGLYQTEQRWPETAFWTQAHAKKPKAEAVMAEV